MSKPMLVTRLMRRSMAWAPGESLATRQSRRFVWCSYSFTCKKGSEQLRLHDPQLLAESFSRIHAWHKPRQAGCRTSV